MELALGQVIAVKGCREGTDLASQGRKDWNGSRQRTAAKTAEIMNGKDAIYFHGENPFLFFRASLIVSFFRTIENARFSS